MPWILVIELHVTPKLDILIPNMFIYAYQASHAKLLKAHTMILEANPVDFGMKLLVFSLVI